MPGYTEYVLAEGSFSYGQTEAVTTAYLNVLIEDDQVRTSGWLSATRKVSDAGAAGILNPMPDEKKSKIPARYILELRAVKINHRDDFILLHLYGYCSALFH